MFETLAVFQRPMNWLKALAVKNVCEQTASYSTHGSTMLKAKKCWPIPCHPALCA
jgi:hypothetical protein